MRNEPKLTPIENFFRWIASILGCIFIGVVVYWLIDMIWLR